MQVCSKSALNIGTFANRLSVRGKPLSTRHTNETVGESKSHPKGRFVQRVLSDNGRAESNAAGNPGGFRTHGRAEVGNGLSERF